MYLEGIDSALEQDTTSDAIYLRYELLLSYRLRLVDGRKRVSI